jgi:organic radical activating enzyme
MILNSPKEREMRARMLLGEKVSSCSSCWKLEDRQIRSPREEVNLEYQTGFKDLRELSELMEVFPSHEERVEFLSRHEVTFSRRALMLEIILKNTCDMQCVYCSHHYSSRWLAERLKYKEIPENQLSAENPEVDPNLRNKLLQWVRDEGAHTMRAINFIGGEPSLIPDFYELSEEMVEIFKEKGNKEVYLSLVTNLNSLPKIFDKFLDHLKKLSQSFSRLDIAISMEAFGERAEYIRHGLNWQRWSENFEKLIQNKTDNMSLSIIPTTNLLSISSLPQFIEYLGEISEKYSVGIGLKGNVVSDPLANSPMLLTEDFVGYFDQAMARLRSRSDKMDSYVKKDTDETFYTWKKYEAFLGTIRDSIVGRQLAEGEKKIIREFYSRYDQRRKLNIYKTFPEYRNFFNECGVAEVSLKELQNEC